MIVNDNLAPVTQEVTDLYWQDENNVARINRIVQYILERETAQKERLAEAERVIAPFAEKFNVLNEKGLTDSTMELGWPIEESHLRAAAEWMKK